MIKVRIHRNELKRAGACETGMQLFESLQRRGVFRSNWTPLHMIWFATVHPGFSSWMIEQGLLPRVNLRGADLCGADLYGANLYGADLYGANLYGADLRGADLYGANLRGANLRGANLYGADLCGADLYGANLYGADLYGANLRGADLRGADLYGAYNFSLPEGWELVNGIVRRK